VRRRILTAILSVTGIAVVLFGVPLALVVKRVVDEDAMLRLERQAVLATREVPGDFTSGADPVELPEGRNGATLTLYDGQGHRVAGNGPGAPGAVVTQALRNEIASAKTGRSRVVAVPVTADESVVGVIRAEQSTAASSARARRLIMLIATLAAGVVAIGALIGYVLAGRLARPVRRLRDVAVQLGEGDFTVEVPRSPVREIDEAAQAMNATARRLDDLLRRERAFSADASHQLRTPLAGLRAGLETELQFPRPDRSAILRDSIDDIGVLERTITELLAIARTPAQQPAACSLGAVFDDLESSWHGRFASAGRPLVLIDAHDAPMLKGNGALLRQALDVLLDNALVHGDGEARVWYDLAPESVTIHVTNEGAAFSSNGDRIDGAHPDAGETHGLGLPLAERLVDALPGRLSIVRSDANPQIDIVVGLK
jgi:signal transduction histidine kinase